MWQKSIFALRWPGNRESWGEIYGKKGQKKEKDQGIEGIAEGKKDKKGARKI